MKTQLINLLCSQLNRDSLASMLETMNFLLLTHEGHGPIHEPNNESTIKSLVEIASSLDTNSLKILMIQIEELIDDKIEEERKNLINSIDLQEEFNSNR